MINLDCTYGYHGANCISIILENSEDGHVTATNEYGETMAKYLTTTLLVKFITDLQNEEYTLILVILFSLVLYLDLLWLVGYFLLLENG